jgi:hypothetical protein
MARGLRTFYPLFMTFFRMFDRRFRLNDTGAGAVEESPALQGDFPETEEPSQPLLSCVASN